ncbi:MAG: hypothetical protein Q4G50_13180 [Corynebacterium sp.]|uniref:hypothetical protein n=1 Tax=Corynebacterium sp. TaxID=1720 RepID=UPI0026DFF49C|nr:hypothetical protein [Corynebacterium sp.]MDO5670937.1 hypothetical protein [Corynebacterium sp.]
MTGLLIRLHRTLWARSMKANQAAWIMAILVMLYALIGIASFTFTVWMLDPAERDWGWAGVFAIGTLGYIAVMVVIPSGEGQLKAADFASLPVSAREILPAMAAAALLSTRGVTAVVATVLTTALAVWMSGPVWLLVAPLTLVVTLLLGEVVRTFSAGAGRVSSERMNVLSGVLVIAMIFGFNVLINYGTENIPLNRIGGWLAWSPVGAAGGVVAALADAAFLTALAHLLIVVLTVAAGVWWWQTVVARKLIAPLDEVTREDTGERTEGVLLRGLPETPAAMVYSRGVRYFRRDPRMLGAIAAFPLVAIILLVQGYSSDLTLYMGIVFLALASGAVAANDYGYDGPAGWTHLVTPVPARSLVLGRHLAQLTPMLILLLIFDIAALILADDTARAMLVVGLSLGMFITVAALALLLSAFNPFPTAQPGTSPWADKSGFSGAAFVATFGSLLTGWIPVVPGAIVAFLGWPVPGVLLAIALPALLYWFALRAAVRRVETSLPEIYAKVHRWVN